MSARLSWAAAAILAASLLLLATGSFATLLRPGLSTAVLVQTSQMIHAAGPLGLGLAMGAQILIAASGLLPASLLGLAAGAIYGVVPGTIVAATSTLVGALLTFGLSRSLFGSILARLLPPGPRLKAFDAMLTHDGWKLVCLLRVSPVMPFAATSYALGLTSIRTLPFLVGTLASLPALFGFVVMGSLTDTMLSAWATGMTLMSLGLLAVGILATGLATLRIGQLVWRAVQATDVGALPT